MKTLQNRLKTLVMVTALFGTVGLYAGNCGQGQGYKDCNKNYQNERCDYKEKKKKKDCYGDKFYKHNGYKGDRQYRSHHKGNMSRFFIGAVYSLDLTKEQQVKVDELIKTFQENRMKKFDAFTEKGFDKEAYINARLKMKEDMVRAKADLIENVYKVLTSEQKKELKEEIDDFKQIRGKNGKSCNGRR